MEISNSNPMTIPSPAPLPSPHSRLYAPFHRRKSSTSGMTTSSRTPNVPVENNTGIGVGGTFGGLAIVGLGGSKTGRRLSQSASASASASASSQDPSVRAAKKHLQEIVRTDWEFPAPGTALGGEGASSETPALPYPDSEIKSWVERTYDSSSSFSDSEPDANTNTIPPPRYSPPKTWRTKAHTHARTKSDPYKFESPDAVHVETVGLLAERKRRRRKREREEMAWNAGLKVWTDRRNVWCGAREKRNIPALNRDLGQVQVISSPPNMNTNTEDARDTLAPLRPPLSRGNTLTLTISNTSALAPTMSNSSTATDGTTITITPLSDPDDPNQDLDFSDLLDGGSASASTSNYYDSASDEPPSPTSPPDSSRDIYLPLPPPLLPPDPVSHKQLPIRVSITPALYPKIYDMVVLRGLTPTIPINLADVTRAIVGGWQEEGNWPPKPATSPVGEVVVVRRKKGAKDGIGMGQGGEGGSGKVKRGVGAVRKALGLDGGN